jgi:hypothetical protein
VAVNNFDTFSKYLAEVPPSEHQLPEVSNIVAHCRKLREMNDDALIIAIDQKTYRMERVDAEIYAYKVLVQYYAGRAFDFDARNASDDVDYDTMSDYVVRHSQNMPWVHDFSIDELRHYCEYVPTLWETEYELNHNGTPGLVIAGVTLAAILVAVAATGFGLGAWGGSGGGGNGGDTFGGMSGITSQIIAVVLPMMIIMMVMQMMMGMMKEGFGGTFSRG